MSVSNPMNTLQNNENPKLKNKTSRYNGIQHSTIIVSVITDTKSKWQGCVRKSNISLNAEPPKKKLKKD